MGKEGWVGQEQEAQEWGSLSNVGRASSIPSNRINRFFLKRTDNWLPKSVERTDGR